MAGQDADDVIQRVAEQFVQDPTGYMLDYTPEKFAHVALRSRAEDHRRSERIQRGEGARLHVGADGLRRPGHEVGSIDVLDPESDHLGADEGFEWGVVTNHELGDALRLLEPRIADLLILVAVQGFTVTEAAEQVELSRSYASRQLAAAKRLLAEVITAA